MHKGYNRLNSCPIYRIIRYYCDHLNYHCDYFETRLRTRRGRVATALKAGGWDQQLQSNATPPRSRRSAAALAALAAGGGDQRRQFSILEHSMFLSWRKTECFTIFVIRHPFQISREVHTLLFVEFDRSFPQNPNGHST